LSSTVALQLVDVLREFGVDRVFGIPGGAVSAMYAALAQRSDVQVVTAKHETGAAFMAIGYTLATRRPGVVVTTAGPGITNALTGLASAFHEGAPVLFICGEVPRSAFGRGALQEGSSSSFDAVAMARRLSKFSAQINRPGSAAAVLRKALATAFSGRKGPAFVSLPLDVAMAEGSSQRIGGAVWSSFEIDHSLCREAVQLLGVAARPLILAGSGARDTTNRRALRRLAERMGAPVAVTTKAKGVFPEDHPLYLGVYGFGGHESVIAYLEGGVDVLLACGTGLNDFSTNAWSPLLQPKRAFIQVDIDAGQLGKNYSIDIGILGPIDMVLNRMLEQPFTVAPRHDVPWAGPSYQPIGQSPTGMLTTADVVLVLNEVCPPTSVFTADMGEHLAYALHYLRVRAAGDFFTCLGFGSMGSGIVSAIGYQFGAPQRRTFAVCGDGGFLMYGAELATAVQHRVATTFAIINDSRLNMVHHGMRDLYGSTPDFSTQVIDFAAYARAVGAAGEVIHSRAQLTEALTRPVDGPLVLDIRVDPNVRLGGSQRNAALRQFQEGRNE
jgi:acetolactate synthase I/II/III large subunit